MASFRVVSVYPDLLGTYGDRGNAVLVARALGQAGHDVELLEVPSWERLPQAHYYLIGGGEDSPQVLATERLRKDGRLAAVSDGSAVGLAVCAGFQLIGKSFVVSGNVCEGLGFIDATTFEGTPRAVGEYVGEPVLGLGQSYLSGFENHGGRTAIGAGISPLSRRVIGVGNGDGLDGAIGQGWLATYLHGPVFARNSGLLEYFVALQCPRFVLGQDIRSRIDSVRKLRESILRGVTSKHRL